ncbi:DUF5302 domain-containing protein [Amycolatopsis taiwanensis]|uniref:DUF5302 domain-containing protein n=1 Tax=Amycolatopsis taiwanensis TaxID=342230 RepID=A0A9W6VCB3_9PSEU|nr:DUF5302 domain-containing protein [Amycolatopsis taiwanensis]GLY65963.1 hypothetical protein Atai01_25820 [Amycolatopsis taiwanensis]
MPENDSSDPTDDVKRKFREALERKQTKARNGSAHDNGGAKNAHAHGPAASKRTFRRKSG